MLNIRHCEAPKPSLIDHCVDRLLQGAVVIVDIQRLQHLVVDKFNHRKHSDGHQSWPTPQVFTLDVWLRRVWNHYAQQTDGAVATLLSANQSQEIWERVIAQHVRSEYQTGYEYLLWHITATANSVREAYRLLRRYEMDLTQFPAIVSDDVRHFQVWLKAYQQSLAQQNCIDLECLIDHIGKHSVEIFRASEDCLVFAGFDVWPPQLERLIQSLKQTVRSIDILDPPTTDQPKQQPQLEFATLDEELAMCARWARAVMDANPQAHRVGIVAPNLTEIASQLRRKLAAYLNPEELVGDRHTNRFAFYVTMGSDLKDAPIVVDAMNILELIRSEVFIEAMAAVVLSDRIKHWDTETAERSKLSEAIYSVGGDRLSIDNVIYLASRKKHLCPELVHLLRDAKMTLAECPIKATYAFWGQFFMHWIEIFQVRQEEGERRFGVDEWQAYRSWGSVV